MAKLGSGQRAVLAIVQHGLVVLTGDIVTLTNLSRERVRQICDSLVRLRLIEIAREPDGVRAIITLSGMKENLNAFDRSDD
jgi:archaellum biogenesis ATPase FlaH